MNDVISYLRRYEGKKVRVKTIDDSEIEGRLEKVEKSKHGGVGNIILCDDDNNCYLIRGSNIILITLDVFSYSSKSINK
ncbi:MAG: hypothetical protein QXW01_02320 [Candidatus Aenigmatarchaeota archaeon]